MSNTQPKITVVTPSYNQGRYLEKTIRSVLSQGYESLEYIVLDGGSTDGSVDIIKAYAKELAFWHSGPDGGQAAAIKHGMEMGTGEVVCWLNSDDIFLPGALAEVARQYQRSDWVLLAGRNAIIDQHDNATHVQVPKKRSIEGMLTWGHGLAQMATFYRKSAMDAIGGIDAALEFAFDFDLFIRLKKYGRFQYTDQCFTAARLHSESKSSCIAEVGRRECGLLSDRYSSVPFLNNLRSFTREHDYFFQLRNRLAWTLEKQSVIDAVSLALSQGAELAAKIYAPESDRRRNVCA